MEVDVITSDNQEIDFAPSNTVKEVVQNVKTICSTPNLARSHLLHFTVSLITTDMSKHIEGKIS